MNSRGETPFFVGQKSFIKPSFYETMKKKSFKKKIGKKENMKYIQELNEYICHNNRRLKFVYFRNKKSKSGYQLQAKVYSVKAVRLKANVLDLKGIGNYMLH